MRCFEALSKTGSIWTPPSTPPSSSLFTRPHITHIQPKLWLITREGFCSCQLLRSCHLRYHWVALDWCALVRKLTIDLNPKAAHSMDTRGSYAMAVAWALEPVAHHAIGSVRRLFLPPTAPAWLRQHLACHSFPAHCSRVSQSETHLSFMVKYKPKLRNSSVSVLC